MSRRVVRYAPWGALAVALALAAAFFVPRLDRGALPWAGPVPAPAPAPASTDAPADAVADAPAAPTAPDEGADGAPPASAQRSLAQVRESCLAQMRSGAALQPDSDCALYDRMLRREAEVAAGSGGDSRRAVQALEEARRVQREIDALRYGAAKAPAASDAPDCASMLRQRQTLNNYRSNTPSTPSQAESLNEQRRVLDQRLCQSGCAPC